MLIEHRLCYHFSIMTFIIYLFIFNQKSLGLSFPTLFIFLENFIQPKYLDPIIFSGILHRTVNHSLN